MRYNGVATNVYVGMGVSSFTSVFSCRKIPLVIVLMGPIVALQILTWDKVYKVKALAEFGLDRFVANGAGPSLG
jgi:hypothetical protein